MSRILIIDDSKLQRTFARLALEQRGHDVLEAADGRAGMERVREDQPDCVLLDLLMPDMSGVDVLRALQREGARVPVVVTTAGKHVEGQEECMQAGAAAVLKKSNDPQQLTEAINAALSQDSGENP